MIKIKLIRLYEVMFNFFTKKDGYDSTAHIFPSCVVGLTLLFFFLSIACLISLITGEPFLYHSHINKGLSFLYAAIYFVLIYIILFHVLKIEKQGSEEHHLFLMDDTTVLKVWIFFIANIVISFTLIFLTIKFVKP